ncbi:hypothetical protein DVH24_000988 [Malus domestica]|uniref:Uncharacterized protein n=1 Tax=Malus domestica TaxID=3750 RepID=A0A498K377_MALDO|nr:hypothetical protein DVH24_000988 [Malus domestica]
MFWHVTFVLRAFYTKILFIHVPYEPGEELDEEALVEIYISNIIADYRVYLENIGINQFSRLLEVVRKTSLLVKFFF